MAKDKKDAKKLTVKTLDDFHAKFGNQKVDVLDRSQNARQWSTGSLNIDEVSNGGLPMGKMVELYGPPGGGKSTVALKTASLVLKQGKRVVYFDLEGGLDLRNAELTDDGFAAELADETPKQKAKRKKERDSWLRTNGIDPLDPNLEIYEPYSGEELFTMLAAAVDNSLFALMIVDSVPAIMPTKMLEGEPGDGNFGARAKLLSEELPRIQRIYANSGNVETTIIWINQVRENIGAQIKSQKSTGGYSLEHFIRYKAKCQRIRRVEQGDDLITESRFKVEKNIYGRPGETRFRMSANRGIDTLAELLDVARDYGYVQQSGNWHYFFEEPVDSTDFSKAHKKKTIADLPGYLAGMNGEGAALEWMGKNGWEDKMFAVAKKA